MPTKLHPSRYLQGPFRSRRASGLRLLLRGPRARGASLVLLAAIAAVSVAALATVLGLGVAGV